MWQEPSPAKWWVMNIFQNMLIKDVLLTNAKKRLEIWSFSPTNPVNLEQSNHFNINLYWRSHRSHTLFNNPDHIYSRTSIGQLSQKLNARVTKLLELENWETERQRENERKLGQRENGRKQKAPDKTKTCLTKTILPLIIRIFIIALASLGSILNTQSVSERCFWDLSKIW